MKKAFTLILTFYFTCSFGQSLNDKIEKLATSSPLPGFSISVVSFDSILFQQAYGYADKGNEVRYDINHSQIIASVSKTFIGVSLLKCVEMGILDLDEDINKYLPFQVINPYYPDAEITAKHLATHTSGITDNIPDQFKVYFNEDPKSKGLSFDKKTEKLVDEVLKQELLPLSEILASIFVEGESNYSKKNFLNKAPGTTYRYSNTAGSLAALMIEHVSGISYEVFVSKHILDPLQMSNSTFYPDQLDNQIRAIHYTGGDQLAVPVYTSRLRPIGGLSTSIADLSKYLMEMIKGYIGKGTLLSEKSYQMLFEEQFTTLPDKHPSNESNQGIFWTYRGDLIGHTGGGLGASSFLFFNPTTGIGKIFITNCELESSKIFVPTFQQVWAEMTEFEKDLK